jgi:hypothetical protein
MHSRHFKVHKASVSRMHSRVHASNFFGSSFSPRECLNIEIYNSSMA